MPFPGQAGAGQGFLPPAPKLSPPERCRRAPISPGFFVNRAALPVRVYALSAGSAPLGRAWFLGATLQAPLFSLSWPRFPLSGRVPRGQAAPSRGLYCEQGSTPCAHFSTFRRERPTRDGLVFGERSSPRYSSFSAFSALAILSFMAPPPSSRVPPTKRCLCRGPPRATKVQQLLIFGLTPSPDEAVQRSDRLLPASGEPGGPARFSPDFRASSQKRGRRGLARDVFRILWGISPLAM